MKSFETPVVEIICLETQDVITTSFNGKDDDLVNSDGSSKY